MGIQIQWDNNEKTILLVTFEAEWTWEDLVVIDAHATALYSTVPHIVDIVADVRHNRLILSGVLSYVRSLLILPWNPRAGMAVVVGANTRLRTLFEAAARLADKPLTRIGFADSLEEARTLIAAARAQRGL
ncbi:MAG: hypothetical protein HXY40_03940 [Chloroflexi bacterium]|nr:hypothetical protein [Chloroflexota bacterium]